MLGKVKHWIQGLRKREIILYAGVVVVAATFAIGMTLYKDTFDKFGYWLLLVELFIIVTYTWALAGHAVMKSLFVVGASLSLIIFLAQSYCQSGKLTPSGNEALMTLVGFSMLYIGFDFFRTLYLEIKSRFKTLKEINQGKHPWIFLIPFVLFIALFVWQVWQVIEPIIKGLCVYH